ncbi:hypothetical protein PLESTM_001469600 [Pleodorina starrii]|nr:hypothetical protein PLESTM_001469600 [Pleodorina starrii]
MGGGRDMPSRRPPLRGQHPRALLKRVPFFLSFGLVCWLATTSYFVCASSIVHEEIGVSTGNTERRLQATEDGTARRLILDVIDAADLYDAVAKANPSDGVVLNLPPGTLVLASTLKIPMSATLQGAPAKENGDAGTILSCGPGDHGLLHFSGSQLRLIGVQLQDCKGPGLLITSGAGARITIESCLFQNFSRVLAPGRVDVFHPGSPENISESTLALAVHAGNFSGQLMVRNTRFVNNRFEVSLRPKRRRLHDNASLSSLGGLESSEEVRDQPDPWAKLTSALQMVATSSSRDNNAHARRMAAKSSGSQTNNMSAWHMNMESSGGLPGLGATMSTVANYGQASERRRTLQGGSGSKVITYSMPILEKAELIHPGLQVGPWADDLEAVFSVVCKNQGCAITFQNSTFDKNIGVATGALYALCDGATACDIDLSNVAITNNRVLWQTGGVYALESLDGTPPPPEPPWPAAALVLARMAAWLTSTYTLLNSYNTVNDPIFSELQVTNLALYPNVVGRTLGAVVFHQRNSPWPGVSPTESRPMMRVNVNGGVLRGNEGSALMSTATDFMRMAGGNGTWSGGPPRHSADFYISGVNITDHASGWPAIWLRWARKVEMRKLQVTNSNGAAWLDEVRDSALVEDSVFLGGSIGATFVDFLSFIYFKLQFQMLKIQMTSLGDVQNSAVVRRCHFEGNPSFITGVVSIHGSEQYNLGVEELPGRTLVEVSNSTFINNLCISGTGPDGTCGDPQRVLYIYAVTEAHIQNSRFIRNGLGGVMLSYVHRTVVNQSTFDGNNNSYSSYGYSKTYIAAFGGGGVFCRFCGNGGVEITDTNFTNNYAAVSGGAVYLAQSGYLQISRSRFVANTAATLDGGAIVINVARGVRTSLIESCTFESNTAGRNGGAIAAHDISLSIVTGIQGQSSWYIIRSNFTNNVALLNPTKGEPDVANLPQSYDPDQAGGGAVYAQAASLYTISTLLRGNKVLAHAGGAIRVIGSDRYLALNCTYENNVAVLGGAVALTRVRQGTTFGLCTFTNNTVVDPSWQFNPSKNAVPLVDISAGYGGALFASFASVLIFESGTFVGNSAKHGGAIASLSSPTFYVADRGNYTYSTGIKYLNVSRDIVESVGQLELLGGLALPYRFLFKDNTALIGGAIYLYDVETSGIATMNYTTGSGLPALDEGVVNTTHLQTEEAYRFRVLPAIIFYGNTANGGGAIYLRGNGYVDISNSSFIANSAVVPPLAANWSGLNGLEKDPSTAKALPCYNGGGGAICVIGQANKKVLVYYSSMVNNFAKDGAGIYLAEGLDCADQANCYNVTVHHSNMTGNIATNRGGGVFWTHEGILSIPGCPSDRQPTVMTNGTALLHVNGSANSTNTSSYTIRLRMPVRKHPASWYSQLTLENHNRLLSTVGGAVRASSHPFRTTDGEIDVAGNPVFVLGSNASKALNGTIAVEGAYLTAQGYLAVVNISAGESVPADWVHVGGRYVVQGNSILTDPSWLGVPYNYLPCTNWNNSADTGPDVATTPYFILSPQRLNYYTSNSNIKINVTVHDWLGQHCTEDKDTQPLVLVQADSKEVLGSVLVSAVNGTAEFTELRLRGREGLHTVPMTGRSLGPVRQLLSSELQIYVRPCAINEFLSPKNLDECIPCEPGAFNLNASATICTICPYNAECMHPDPSACPPDTECDPTGYLVPKDGYWHANFFSEEVIGCTNPEACMTPNRYQTLSKMQLDIWEVARQIQLDAATAVADMAAAEALAKLLSSAPYGRRLLQRKALNDSLGAVLILNATASLLPEYLQSQCAPGYTGTLCGECLPGYGWRGIAVCSKCHPRVLNNLYYVLVTLLMLLVLAFTVYSSLKEQRQARKIGNASEVMTTQGGNDHFHAIMAAAAAEDAAEEAAQAAIALGWRPHTLAQQDFGAYGIPDRVLSAARNTLGDSPATPQRLFELDVTAWTQSVTGRPVNAAARCVTSCESPYQPTLPPSRMGGSAIGIGGGSPFSVAGVCPCGSPFAFAGGSYYPGPRAGPVAEGTENDDNALIQKDDAALAATIVPTAAAYVSFLQSTPEEEEDAREGHPEDRGFAAASERVGGAAGRRGVGGRPAAQWPADGYTNTQNIGQQPMEINCEPPAVCDKGLDGGDQQEAAPRYPEMAFHAAQEDVGQRVPKSMSFQESLAALSPNETGLTGVMDHIQLDRVPDPDILAGRERAHQSTVVKIFLSYVQVLALLQNVQLEIPGVIDVYYRINNQAISYPERPWPAHGAHLVSRLRPRMLQRITHGAGDGPGCAGGGNYCNWYGWWESVIMLRKLFVAVIVTLVDDAASSGVQLLLVICVLVLSVGIHLMAMPYKHAYTNNLELLSLCVLLATLYFSMYFSFSDSVAYNGRVLISILILVINAIMVLICFYYIIQAYSYTALEKAGLSHLDKEERHKLTAAEIRQRILANLEARSSTAADPQQDGQQRLSARNRSNSARKHVASLYTAAVWTSMRMESTTNKVINKMRTLLSDPPETSHPPTLQSSVSVRAGQVRTSTAGAANPRHSAILEESMSVQSLQGRTSAAAVAYQRNRSTLQGSASLRDRQPAPSGVIGLKSSLSVRDGQAPPAVTGLKSSLSVRNVSGAPAVLTSRSSAATSAAAVVASPRNLAGGPASLMAVRSARGASSIATGHMNAVSPTDSSKGVDGAISADDPQAERCSAATIKQRATSSPGTDPATVIATPHQQQGRSGSPVKTSGGREFMGIRDRRISPDTSNGGFQRPPITLLPVTADPHVDFLDLPPPPVENLFLPPPPIMQMELDITSVADGQTTLSAAQPPAAAAAPAARSSGPLRTQSQWLSLASGQIDFNGEPAPPPPSPHAGTPAPER